MRAGIQRDDQPAWPRGTPDHTFSLPGGIKAPAAARRAVGDCIRDRLPAERCHDALVLISELVTNAVRHAGAGPSARIEIRLATDLHRATFAVCDTGSGFEPPATPVPRPGGGGFGLVLLNAMSEVWGVHPHRGAGTCVWFVLDR